MLRVIGTSAWRGLQGVCIPKVVHVDFMNIFDMQCLSNSPVFPDVQSLSVRSCDKNWSYYHIDKRIFPQAQQVILFSHPCEFPVVYRFPRTFIDEGHYRQYLGRWWNKEDDNVIQVSFHDMNIFWSQLEEGIVPEDPRD